MGIDAELYAATAAASRDQPASTEAQCDVIKSAPAHIGGSTAAGGNIAQNGDMNSGTQQEGMFVV